MVLEFLVLGWDDQTRLAWLFAMGCQSSAASLLSLLVAWWAVVLASVWGPYATVTSLVELQTRRRWHPRGAALLEEACTWKVVAHDVMGSVRSASWEALAVAGHQAPANLVGSDVEMEAVSASERTSVDGIVGGSEGPGLPLPDRLGCTRHGSAILALQFLQMRPFSVSRR